MRILCTGNPDKKTIAWAVRQKWSNAATVSLSQGYDLRLLNEPAVDKFTQKIIECDVFINSSYIAQGVQANLLERTVQKWMEHDIKGHVFNIGTTLEWDQDNISEYKDSKIAFRNASLDLNKQTGITGVKCTYIMLGGVSQPGPKSQDGVDPLSIVAAIEWIAQTPERIGLIQIDSVK